MKDKIYKFLKKKSVMSYLIICFIAIFICIPLFSKYMNISADDGIQHICRLIGTYDSIKENNTFPVIMSGFCNGFGYSWNIFYSPLTAFIPLIFKLFTNSFVVCLKLFMFCTILLSGIFMHNLVYKISKSHKAGIISAVCYMIAPYHLTDLYTRIAVAELASFIFLPIVFLGMYELFNQKRNYYMAIGAIGLALSHNVITIYAAIFCFIYLLVNYKKIDRYVIKNIIINILIILLCTSFYWIPLLEHYFATTYEVFIPGRMYKDNTLIGSKLKLSDLFITKPYDMSFHIGIPIILGIICSIFNCKRIKSRYKKIIITFLTFGLTSIIMTLKVFPFENMPGFLKMIQFTWRMMEFATFFLSIVSGITITMFINGNNKKEIIFVVSLIIYTSVLILTTKREVEIPFNEKDYLEPIEITASTRQVHAGCATFEYLPQKAFQNRAYIEKRIQKVLVLEGNANIISQNKNGTNMKFEIENAKEAKLELPYIYYLGYKVEINKEDGTKQKVKIKESDNGFCMIEIPELERAIVNISYKGTTLMKISYIMFVIGVIMLIYEAKTKYHVKI